MVSLGLCSSQKINYIVVVVVVVLFLLCVCVCVCVCVCFIGLSHLYVCYNQSGTDFSKVHCLHAGDLHTQKC